MSQPKYKRRKKLIKPSLQLKLALTFLAAAGTAILVQAILLNRTLTEIAHQVPNDGIVVLQKMPGAVATNLLLTFLLLVPLILGIGIQATFKIAGPVYRFETYLKAVIRGEETGPCRIREGDELWDLCHLITEVTEPLRAELAAKKEQQEGADTPTTDEALESQVSLVREEQAVTLEDDSVETKTRES